MVKEYKALTKEQVEFFLENGYVVIPGALLDEYADKFTKDIWVRLGYDPKDKSTWDKERIHMPWHRGELAKVMAPRAWAAICEICGGEDRISDTCAKWRDNIIINLGTEQWEKESIGPKELDNWHVDGDFFRHFLDSPEQGLLVIPLFADINPRGGGTYIAPDGIEKVAKYLRDHPEGTYPSNAGGFAFKDLIPECKQFVEISGKKGDVALLHPLMLHSASKNHLREPRLITNPPISLKEPFNFNRENPDEFSLVELKTLKALGVDRYDFKLAHERERVIPKRLLVQNRILDDEIERLKAHQMKTGIPSDSIHLVGGVKVVDTGPAYRAPGAIAAPVGA